MTAEFPQDKSELIAEAARGAFKEVQERNTDEFARQLALHEMLKEIATGRGRYEGFTMLLLTNSDTIPNGIDVQIAPVDEVNTYSNPVALQMIPDSRTGYIGFRFVVIGTVLGGEMRRYVYRRGTSWEMEDADEVSPVYWPRYRKHPPNSSFMYRFRRPQFPELNKLWAGNDGMVLVNGPHSNNFIGNDPYFPKINLSYFQDGILQVVSNATNFIPPRRKTR